MVSPCEEHKTVVDVLHRLDTAIPLLQKDIAYLRRDQELILSRFGQHVEDANRDGGWHSRIIAIETDLRNMKLVGRWFMVGSGLISGLIVAGGMRLVTIIVGILK